MTTYRQLALKLPRRTQAADFLAAPSNARALACLDADWPDHRLWLWGPPGCGKTHLLHRWLGGRRAVGEDAALLDAGALPRPGEAPPAGNLAIDAVETAGDEHALLHLLNSAAERRIPLLLASRESPARLPARLPDLASRLRATLAVAIEPPEDDLLDALLVRLLSDRQVIVSPAVGRYLRARLPRDPDTLRQAVERLDAASLAGHRPITVALAGRLLAELSDTEASPPPVSANGPDLV